jgi:transcriptional regulator with XRE-family HTH domain
MAALRTRMGWSQGELATRMGYARAYINRLEKGRLSISAEVDERLRGLEQGVTYQDTSQGKTSALEESQSQHQAVNINPRHALPVSEPTVVELRSLFEEILADCRRTPGGFYNLTRALKRFQKEHLEPID